MKIIIDLIKAAIRSIFFLAVIVSAILAYYGTTNLFGSGNNTGHWLGWLAAGAVIGISGVAYVFLPGALGGRNKH
jgi:hypothetical protein